jgi:hypothetical protein
MMKKLRMTQHKSSGTNSQFVLDKVVTTKVGSFLGLAAD